MLYIPAMERSLKTTFFLSALAFRLFSKAVNCFSVVQTETLVFAP